MSPSKKTTGAATRAAQKPSGKKSDGKKIEAVKPVGSMGPTGLDDVHRKILEDYWSHLPPPPDEDEWMSGRI